MGMLDKTYTTAVSIGPVFPHEVSGFSNGLKNLLVGLGGKSFVDYSHWLGALYGIERIMGRLGTPVRRVFNYAHEDHFETLGIVYVLTVIDKDKNLRGLYVGNDPETHARAAALSKQLNVNVVDEPLDTVVVNLDPSEFTSFWLCNKAVYRTRMGIADNGHLIAIAPGLRSCADDPVKNRLMDGLIMEYGYHGTPAIMKAVADDILMRENLSVAAHLIHGSPEGRFRVTFATDPSLMPESLVRRLGFEWMDVHDAIQKYLPSIYGLGMQRLPGGERFYFVPDPSNVLLSTKDKMK